MERKRRSGEKVSLYTSHLVNDGCTAAIMQPGLQYFELEISGCVVWARSTAAPAVRCTNIVAAVVVTPLQCRARPSCDPLLVLHIFPLKHIMFLFDALSSVNIHTRRLVFRDILSWDNDRANETNKDTRSTHAMAHPLNSR